MNESATDERQDVKDVNSVSNSVSLSANSMKATQSASGRSESATISTTSSVTTDTVPLNKSQTKLRPTLHPNQASQHNLDAPVPPVYPKPKSSASASASMSPEGRDDQSFSGSIPYNFSDDSEQPDDKYNSISDLLVKAKKALKSGGGMLTFQKNLVSKMYIIRGEPKPADPTLFDADDELQSVVLDTWTGEVLKFLALKTITGDTTEPCQLLPGHAVGVGWRQLMITPSLYSKVCLSMGNPNVFDHDPSDTASSRVQEKHKVKRYNATLRAYESYFDEQPPPLYWNFHKKKQKVADNNIFSNMIRQCGVDISFLSDPLAMESKTKEQGMSPSMPHI